MSRQQLNLGDGRIMNIILAARAIASRSEIVTASGIARELKFHSAVPVLLSVIEHDAWDAAHLDKHFECTFEKRVAH